MANGFALGGFGQGMSQGFGQMMQFQQLQQQQEQFAQKMELERATLDIARKKLSVEERDAGVKNYQESLKSLIDTIDKAPDINRTNAFLDNMKQQGLFEKLEASAALYGQPGGVEQTLRARVGLKLTPEAEGEAVGRKAEAASRAGGAAAKAAERAPEQRNYATPDGRKGIVNANDPDAIAALPSGTVLFTVQAQPTTTDFAQPGKTEAADTRKIVGETTANLSDLKTILGRLEETQGAAGLRGTIAEAGAGLLSQLPVIGEGAAETFSQAVGGASQQEITEVRTRARLQVSRMLRTITQETSGRFTDTERRIAAETLQTLTPTAGGQQIRAALKVAMESELFSRERAKAMLNASPFLDDALVGNETAKLMGMGFTKQEAVDIARRLRQSLMAQREQFNARPKP